jgi:thymidylate synthase
MRQLPKVVDEILRDSGTRRAVVSIRLEEDLQMLGTDSDQEFPCTNSLHFMVRDNKLHLHVSMRSNNMATTVVYDVFNFTMIQEYVLKLLNSKGNYYDLGNYYHNCASAHFFENQLPLVHEVLTAEKHGIPTMIRPEVKK